MAQAASSANPPKTAETPAERAGNATRSMHNGVEVSCDCCSCEAEPYWIDGMREETRHAEQASSPD